MANRVLLDLEENMKLPSWLEGEDKLQVIEDFIYKVMKKLRMNKREVSVMFCTDTFIQNLNREYRNIDSPTDVLSFENGSKYTDEQGKWLCLGDIAISVETLPKNALYFEVSENEELKRLLIHGLLHLKGLDHGEEHVEKNKEPVCKMLRIQKKLMKFFEKEEII